MCGRFTLSKPVRAVADLFKLAEPPAELRPRYNVAPSQLIAVVGLKPDGRTRGLAQLRWGFVSRYSDTPNPKVPSDTETRRLRCRGSRPAAPPPGRPRV